MTRILLIEDEAALREEVLDWLKFEGFEPIEAVNGVDGVDKARLHRPEIILCDISMPKMDGYEVLVALRQNVETTHIPFIFLTARADKTFMRHGMELGADDYLTKPFSRGELLSAIRARLDRHEALSQVFGQDAEQVRSSLLDLVSKDLKAPVTSIRLVQDLIERQVDTLSTGELKGLLDTLRLGTNRLQHLSEQLM